MKKLLKDKYDFKWPDTKWLENSDTNFETDVWEPFLSNPESVVQSDLQVIAQPTSEGRGGTIVLYDQSSNKNAPITIDYRHWCNAELNMAKTAHHANHYKQLFKNYLVKLMDDADWVTKQGGHHSEEDD